MSRDTNRKAPLIITSIFSLHTFAFGAVLGFGAGMDNFQTSRIFYLSLFAAVFVAWGVYLAARHSPKYAYLWLFLIAAPIPFAFRIAQAPSAQSIAHIIIVAATPLLLGLPMAVYFRRKYLRETEQG